jgi:hypothetical protein
MRTPAARVGIVVAALAAAVALFFAVAGSDGDSATARPRTPQPEVRTQPNARSATIKPQSAPAKAKAQPARPKSRIGRIFVRTGKPAGGFKRFEFKRGERVRFLVHADAADEVHIHGFDITRALPANRPVVFTFPADIEGVFEVELHGAHVKIAELRIRP